MVGRQAGRHAGRHASRQVGRLFGRKVGRYDKTTTVDELEVTAKIEDGSEHSSRIGRSGGLDGSGVIGKGRKFG